MKLYLDANAIIYLIEGAAHNRQLVRNRLASMDFVAGDLVLTSRLTWLECRVKPLRDNRTDLLNAYHAFLAQHFVRLIDVSSKVIDVATTMRVKYRVKTPDSIHLATAIDEQVDEFLTADRMLSRCTEIAVTQI